MRAWSRKKKPKNQNKTNNRINLIVAVIFLLAGAIIWKLYNLQFVQAEHYRTVATQQHEVYSQLEPKRGKIFIQDGLPGNEIQEKYPLATNKELALLYAKPNEIAKDEAPGIAEKIYETFNQVKIENNIRKNLDNEFTGTPTPETIALKEATIKLEAEKRKQTVIADYLKILSKENDPYEPLAKKLDEAKVKDLKIKGLDYSLESYRYYPENNVGSQILGFVGYEGDIKRGRYGLEGFFNEELSGRKGSIKTERDARGNWIIINEMEYQQPVDGNDLVLTINRTIQFTVCEKLKESVRKHGADKGTVIILEPHTGAIVAMCSYPDYDPNEYDEVMNINIFNNPAIFDQYEPGSVYKAVTMAAAIDQDKVNPSTTYKDAGAIMINGWNKPIKNSDYETFGAHGVVDMNTVLEFSLNTGAIFAMQQIGYKTFAEYVQKFGFGEKTGIELDGENPGNISNLTTKYVRDIYPATASFGQGITVTPLQMIDAYAVLANGGMLMKPFLVKEILRSDGTKEATEPLQIRRVVSERTAALITGMLVNVVERGHAKGAQIKGYYVAGKTGTAQVASASDKGYGSDTIHTFIGYAPASEPKFVMLTKLDHPRDARFAESTAIPLFGEIATFLINYYQIPVEREVKIKNYELRITN
jgi:cell division protein FtsI/penicillin-binding protein 2